MSEACKWTDPDSGLNAIVYLDAEFSLADIYAQEDSFSIFEPRTIDGYPAVIANRVDSTTSCEVFLATTEEQIIVIDSTAARRDNLDACEWGAEIAGATLKNITE
ncbi:hypothetical protein AHOG_00475 [Actinoalloteichus hoggarensis]|uniref:Uncharacterized protein n=2 Tax=Actinoalloteichus hoggarensis TaxID=1470176 RepID=A0A221VW88_9PSEU|nr:hypothetical protein AHOG_00475 [Actinoalloteichus hoggarensis]